MAGWYQDPHGAGLRWWDGSAWTEHVHAEAPAAPGGQAALDPDALLAMYSVRRGADAGEPSYKGYKSLLVLLALAIVAIVVGLLLVGGGGDDDGASVADPLAVEASAAEAQALTRTAQTAIETYATDNGGTYGGVTPDELVGIEPTLEGAALDVTADANTYTISVTDPLSGGTFSIIRDASGAVSFNCVVAGTTGCPASGDWGTGTPVP